MSSENPESGGRNYAPYAAGTVAIFSLIFGGLAWDSYASHPHEGIHAFVDALPLAGVGLVGGGLFSFLVWAAIHNERRSEIRKWYKSGKNK